MLLILGGLVIICCTVVGTVLLLKQNQAPIIVQPQEGAKVITEENVKEINKEVEEKVARSMFQTHMNTKWTFPDGKSASSTAVMGNSPNNNYPFYFTVSLANTGEEIFRSGVLPVGTEIEEIKLTKELKKGDYPAVVSIIMVDEEGEPIGNNTGVNVTLSVLK